MKVAADVDGLEDRATSISFGERRAYAAVPCLGIFSRRLLKPRPFRVATEGEEQIAISVVDRDRGAGSEAVGAREMDVVGDLPRSRKGAVFVIEVSYIV